MPKISNQKQRLFALYRLLYEETDENSALSMEQILNRLEGMGISAERRAIYDDIDVLNSQFAEPSKDKYAFHIHIAKTKTNPIRYYLENREFDLPDLRHLTESVRVYPFISKGQTKRLIQKLEGFCPEPQRKELRARQYITEYAKSREYTKRQKPLASPPLKGVPNKRTGRNADIFESMDLIHEAIAQNKCISFKYREHIISSKTGEGEDARLRRSNKKHDRISPYALIYGEGYYYLLASTYMEKTREYRLARFRVDKMQDIEQRRYAREGLEQFKEYEREFQKGGEGYAGRFFSIEEGKSQRIEMICEYTLLDTLLDQFGEGLPKRPVDKNHFKIAPLVVVNAQFYGWLFSLGNRARVVSPYDLTLEVKKYLKEIQKMY